MELEGRGEGILAIVPKISVYGFACLPPSLPPEASPSDDRDREVVIWAALRERQLFSVSFSGLLPPENVST